MAKRKPLVFVAGEIVESSNQDTLDLNNATVIAAGSTDERILKDRFADLVNVKDFGAVGNGATDDTAAFRAAVSAALARGAVVYVPDGTYKLDDPIEGEFISFGHPTFVGEGSISYLTDLYNDYVHKTNNINETVTGNKTFSGTTTIATGNIHTKKISGTTVTSSNGTCDLTLGNIFEINATSSNKNIDLTNAPAGNSIIGLVINKGENKAISWPNNIEWAYGSEPELITGSNYIYLMTPNAGTKWYGFSLTQPIDINDILEAIPSIKLKSNGGLAQDSNGIYINTKTDGGLAIDTNNQIYVDFSKITVGDIQDEVNEILTQFGSDGLDEAAVKTIVTNMLLSTGGLAVNSNGKIYVKLKNPGGLAKDSNGLYINLAPNGGLEFNSNNQLKVKVSDLDLGTGSPIALTTLVDGTTIKVVNNKLTINAPGTATLLADGTTVLANNGKLKVNPDTVIDTVHGMIKTGGGILIESGTGKLYIDLTDLTIDPSIIDFDLSNYVTLDAAQTITGIKTFSNGLIGNVTGTATRATADGDGNNIIATYAPLASPELTGTPTAPTPTAGDNSTKLATTAFVQTAIANSSGSAFATNLNQLFFSEINQLIPSGVGTQTIRVQEAALRTIQNQSFPLFYMDIRLDVNNVYSYSFSSFKVSGGTMEEIYLYKYNSTSKEWDLATFRLTAESSTPSYLRTWAYYDFDGTINPKRAYSLLLLQDAPLFLHYLLGCILSPNAVIGGLVDNDKLQVPVIQTDSFGRINSINGTTIRATKNNATNAVYFSTVN